LNKEKGSYFLDKGEKDLEDLKSEINEAPNPERVVVVQVNGVRSTEENLELFEMGVQLATARDEEMAENMFLGLTTQEAVNRVAEHLKGDSSSEEE